jgi:hypothetical protein
MMHEGDGGDMSCEGVDGKYIGKMQLGTSTGPSTRGQLSPALPPAPWGVSRDRCARGLVDHEHLG